MNEEINITDEYYQTIDLDGIDKIELARIIGKIFRLKCNKTIEVRDTYKGYHLIIYCYRDCDLCRLVFDDQDRYTMDLRRPRHLRNILWTEKYYDRVKIKV